MSISLLAATGTRGHAATMASPAITAPRPLLVGIGDQSPIMFARSLYRRLGTRISRLVVPLNAARDHDRRASVQHWLAAARADGIEPLVAFGRFAGQPLTPPSVAAYKRAFLAFRRAFPSVRDFTPWNEANHQSQPTYRRPGRAAAYYEVMRANCPGCRIAAADVLDTHGAGKWIRRFLSALHGPPPTIWGLHNYIDVNRHRRIAHGGTANILKLVRGEIWLTETGGLVKTANFPYNEKRAARAIRYLFTIARAWPTRITRVYVWNWRGVVNARTARRQPKAWDSGLTEPNGRPRPGYYALRGELRRLKLGCWAPRVGGRLPVWLAGCAGT